MHLTCVHHVETLSPRVAISARAIVTVVVVVVVASPRLASHTHVAPSENTIASQV
jgi:hypothetical protein